MRYQIKHADVSFGADEILRDINFEIHDNEKIAVVGRNGCGKTTLLRLIAGDISMSNIDSDETCGITMAGKQRIGFLRQISFPDGGISAWEEVKKVFAPVFACEKRMEEIGAELEKLHAGSGSSDVSDRAPDAGKPGRKTEGTAIPDPERQLLGELDGLQRQMDALRGYSWKTDTEIMFRKFGFDPEDLQRPIGTFSGGQQTRIAFIKLLLERPDILLLDEPTNHLDMPTIEWLEGYLKTYDRAVVIVSHDRMFLDRIIGVTYEIEYHRMKRYVGNYTEFCRQKEENLAKQEKDYEEQQAEIKRLTEWIEKWKNTPTKVAATRSKRMAIEHMVKIEKPMRFDTKTFRALFTPARESVSEVLYTHHLKIGYDTELSEVTFRLQKRERLAIIGENGKGKSTLLKTLVGIIPPLGGRYVFGGGVEYGYFDQQQAVTDGGDPEQTVLEWFWSVYPNLLREDVRSALGAFMFSQEEVEKKMGQLSGGEKVRLALCRIFYTKPNLLILDEPTNHMDILGKEALEHMLKEYAGTVLFVSHDRYFISQIATGILDFGKDGVRQYSGTYGEYLEEKAKREAGIITENYGGPAASGANPGKNGNTGGYSADREERGGRQAERSAGSGANSLNTPTLNDIFDKKKYYTPLNVLSRLRRQKDKYEQQLSESEARCGELRMQMLDPSIASDYEKLGEIQEQLDAEEHNQETLLERMVETEEEIYDLTSRTEE